MQRQMCSLRTLLIISVQILVRISFGGIEKERAINLTIFGALLKMCCYPSPHLFKNMLTPNFRHALCLFECTIY